jgi:hypothetical protein
MANGNPLPNPADWPVAWMSYLMEGWNRAVVGANPGLAAGAGQAPNSLSQPILPGWTFGNSIIVNETNSTSPETERQIVAQDSYGRQLGRVMDAVAALIRERPPGSPPVQALDDLLKLSAKIDAIKEQSLQARAQRLAGELALLKRDHREQFQQVMAEVQKAPGAPASK